MKIPRPVLQGVGTALFCVFVFFAGWSFGEHHDASAHTAQVARYCADLAVYEHAVVTNAGDVNSTANAVAHDAITLGGHWRSDTRDAGNAESNGDANWHGRVDSDCGLST